MSESLFLSISIRSILLSSLSFLKLIIIILIGWHATIKFSIWQGYQKYEYNQYNKAIVHLERATLIYPKKIGKIHTRLAKMYIAQADFDVT